MPGGKWGPVQGGAEPSPLGVGSWEVAPDKFFLNFQVKRAGFCAILLRKNYTRGQKPGQGGLIDPMGLNM